jgi:carotenoid cleavage dioxygenase
MEMNRRLFLKWGLLSAGFGKWEIFSRGLQAAPANPYLSGNYAPVTEELEAADLPVQGKLPPQLRGAFLRNGPNPLFPPTPYHWFDGDGMVHAVILDNGKARYLNRLVRTEGLLKEKAAGHCLYGGLLAGPPFKNAANISIVWHHDRCLATWEGGLPHEIDPLTLKTLGVYSFGGKLSDAFTAHPKIDPVTNELIFFWYSLNQPYLSYGVLSPQGKLIHLAALDLPRPVMMHDFAITRRHAVFLDLPLVFGKQGLKFQPELGARIGVLPRMGTAKQMRWFSIPSCWVYHTLNAYEEGDTVVLYGSRRKEWGKSPAVLYRWQLNLKTGAVSEGPLDDRRSEFPVVHPKFMGGKNRYGYLGLAGAEEFSGILRYDLQTGTSQTFSFGKDRFGGESIVVPSGKGEDDAWLLNILYDKSSGKSEFVIFAAAHPEEGPVARVVLPRRVPYGLHGNWIPSQS